MVPTNAQLATHLRQMAALLRHLGENRFKVKAYQRAADALTRSPVKVGQFLKRGEPLPKIPGVGEGITAALRDVVASGEIAGAKELGKDIPAGAAEIAAASGITVREAVRLIKALNIASVDELRQKLFAGEVRTAVGPKLDFKLRQKLDDGRRLLWPDAMELGMAFRSAIADTAGVAAAEVAGSLRRGRDTVGTIRLVVRTSKPAAIKKLLNSHGGVESVTDSCPDRIDCTLSAGPRLSVRLATERDWGTALVEETGSRAHLEMLKAFAPEPADAPVASEDEWYRARRLPWIPPELREGRAEVDAARENLIPSLVELTDIRGDLHAHTTASDGVASLETMAAAARGRGYGYLAITDHSQSLRIANGLSEKRLRSQLEDIELLNLRLSGFRLLKGSEVDILADGSLDFPDSLLRELDIVIGSIHSRFELPKADQTRRIIRAIENPYLTCVGHLTGRKLLKRPGYQVDIDAVFRAVKKHRKLLEINASPDRLDINDELAIKAREYEIPLLINTDAHAPQEFDFMRYGIQQARRGWQSPSTIVNTLELPELLKRLAMTRPKAVRSTAA